MKPLFCGLVLALASLPSSGHAQTPAADRVATIDAFEEGFVHYDVSYPDARREEALEAVAELRTRASGMSDARFELELARIAALSGNGHSHLLPAPWATRHPRLGVRFVIADDGLFVGDVRPPYEPLLGARVAALEGRALPELRTEWARYTTGREGFRDQSLPVFLESPVMLQAAGLASDSTRVTLTLADGRSVQVGTTTAWPEPEGMWRYMPKSRVIELAIAGRVRGEPLYLQEPESFFRVVPLPDRDAVYVQFRANIDFSGQTDMRALSTAAIDSIRARAPRFIIVDQRFNMGGDLNTTRALMQAVPGIVGEDGVVFAITSGRTFSAGIASLGYLKQAAGDRLVIVGAPIGDELEFWAEGDPLRLPNGSLVLRATERHNYVTGCQEDDCHGSIRRSPIRVRSLEPDVRPRFVYDDIVAGRDPYLDEVFSRIDALRRGGGAAGR